MGPHRRKSRAKCITVRRRYIQSAAPRLDRARHGPREPGMCRPTRDASSRGTSAWPSSRAAQQADRVRPNGRLRPRGHPLGVFARARRSRRGREDARTAGGGQSHLCTLPETSRPGLRLLRLDPLSAVPFIRHEDGALGRRGRTCGSQHLWRCALVRPQAGAHRVPRRLRRTNERRWRRLERA